MPYFIDTVFPIVADFLKQSILSWQLFLYSDFWERKLKIGTGYGFVYTLFATWRPIINTLKPGQNGRHFADDVFQCIFVNENIWISLMFQFPTSQRRSGDKPSSEPMISILLTHICVTRHELSHWPQNPFNDESILVQLMAWCRQAISLYLNQCRP